MSNKPADYKPTANKHQHRMTSKSKIKRPTPTPAQRIILLFNKPFDVLTQFTDDENRKTLADYIPIKDVYAAGRLDKDSEGLLVLTNDGKLQHELANPSQKTGKTYWVQVEGLPNQVTLDKLTKGVQLKDGLTKPAQVSVMSEPEIWPRDPPIRERQNIPTTWLELTIYEGKNRQVRRMTAAVGFPTLRLIRYRVGQWTLDDIANGQYKKL
jgi:23S rRNA pseudouridine2457 synthase